MEREQPVHSFHVDKRTRKRVGETIREYLGFFRGSEDRDAGSRKSELLRRGVPQSAAT